MAHFTTVSRSVYLLRFVPKDYRPTSKILKPRILTITLTLKYFIKLRAFIYPAVTAIYGSIFSPFPSMSGFVITQILKTTGFMSIAGEKFTTLNRLLFVLKIREKNVRSHTCGHFSFLSLA